MEFRLEKKVTLMSDVMVRHMFDNNIENTQEVLRILLNKPDLQVIKSQVQKKYPGTKDIILDVYAKDSAGRSYDIEMQNKNTKDILNRGFFYMCRMISDEMEKKMEYDDAPICIVIFIMDGNPFHGENIPFDSYNMRNMKGERIPNESGILIFNGRYEADDSLSSLMKDFHQTDSDKIANVHLRNSALKYIQGGKNTMIYNPLQEYYEKGTNEGILLGRQESKEEICISLLKANICSEEMIAKLLKMPLEKVLELKKKIS